MKRAVRLRGKRTSFIATVTAAILLFGGVALAYVLANGDVGWDGPGLGQATVKYHIASPTPDITNELHIIELALSRWAAIADITFVKTDTAGLSDSIDIYFAASLGSPHNVNSDGPFGTLAIGWNPDDLNPNPVAGDIWFDEAETWTTNTTGSGTCSTTSCDLYYVALHEIGHALGLSHTLDDFNNNPAGATMSPYFVPIGGLTPGFGTFDVPQTDDTNGIQSIYGVGPGSVLTGVVPALSALGILLFTLLVTGAMLMTYRRRRIAVLVLIGTLLVTLLIPSPSKSSWLKKPTIPELVGKADVIVQGLVTDQVKQGDFQLTTISPSRFIRAPQGAEPDTLVVRSSAYLHSGHPRYERGQEVIVFLTAIPGSSDYATVGSMQGKFEVKQGRVTRGNLPVSDFIWQIQAAGRGKNGE